MAGTVLDTIREDLRESMRTAHVRELVPFDVATGADLLEQIERLAVDFTERAATLVKHANERGFETLLAAVERMRRALEAVTADALVAADARGVHHADGHRSPQAFLQASVNVSDRERTEHLHVARLVELCPQAARLLVDGRLPVAHAVALGRLVANDRIPREELLDALSGFLFAAPLVPHAVFARRVRDWGRLHDPDGATPDAEASHRNRDVRLAGLLDAFVLDGRFGTVQGAKLAAILDRFVDVEFDRDWQAARAVHGDDTCVQHLARTPAQRRADALEQIFLAAIGQGTPTDVQVIVDIITDADTFTAAATRVAAAGTAAAAATPTASGRPAGTPPASPPSSTMSTSPTPPPPPPPSPPPAASRPAAPMPRRHCHTLDGVEIDPVAAVQAAIAGHVRAVVVGADGVIVNQGRKRRLFTGNARVAAILQSGLDRLHRCTYPGCRATPRHIDHATDWASTAAGPTDVANANATCAHHNLWKTAHGYTVRRDRAGHLHTYRPDGTELRPA